MERLDAARDVRLLGLIRTATGGTKDEAEAWIGKRLERRGGQEPPTRPDDLKAAQRASLEALGITVVE